MMNLVTGGGGFIGGHLVQALLERGETVRVLERPDVSLDHLSPDSVDIVRADIRDRPAIDNATSGCRHVYHLAADPNLWRRDPREFDAINHRGTINVLKSALENDAERILHCSTESILTARGFDGGAVESLVLKEEDMIGPYCISKYHAERAAFDLARSSNKVVVVSPTLPTGPGDRHLTPPTRMNVAFCQGRLPAILDCRINLIDVRDVAEGMIAAMNRGRTGIRYLLGHENMLLSEWLQLLGEASGKRMPRFRVPYPVALSVAYISETWARHVSGAMPIATVTGVRLTRRCMHFDPSASLAELGITPRPIQTSAKEAVDWYRQQGWIN